MPVSGEVEVVGACCRNSHYRARGKPNTLHLKWHGANQLAYASFDPAELPNDDLSGHRSVEHEVAVTILRVQDDVEAISEIFQNVINNPWVR